MKLLHIGLGKCGSTFLQRDIFPKIEKETKIKFIILKKIIKINNIKYHLLENKTLLEKDLPDNFIISDEGLFSKGWEFSRIFKSFEYIKKNFSKDTTILIVIRNPYELLNSIYCQAIHEMKIVRPEEFFYIEENIIIRKDKKFNLYNFDYNSLISLYKSYFEKVVVVKNEDLKNFSYLKEIFNLNNNFLDHVKKNANYQNRAISSIGIKSILFLNKFINLEKNQKFIRSFIKPTNNIFGNIRNRIFYQFLLRVFFQHKFDKLIPYKKYFFNKNYIPIDIDKIIKDYNSMKF